MAQLVTPRQPERAERPRRSRKESPRRGPEKRIPPLENGDHLTRAEFELRYDAMPNLKKAELIEGIVYMGSPVRTRDHGAPHFNVIGWLGVYSAETPGIIGGDNASVRLDMDNEPQPDAFLIIDPRAGGQARIGKDGYVEGAPELVVEVAASSASYDLHEKLSVYRRNGVREYVVWRVHDEAIDWFILEDGVYVPQPPDDMSILRSRVFPGLALDGEAMKASDMRRVTRAQRAALKSVEYKQFAARLEQSLKQAP